MPRDPHNFRSAISCARQVCVVTNFRVRGIDDFLVPELKMLTFMLSLESPIHTLLCRMEKVPLMDNYLPVLAGADGRSLGGLRKKAYLKDFR